MYLTRISYVSFSATKPCSFLCINCISCRNPGNPNDGLEPPQSCMSKGGIPVQPYFVLGGFEDDDNATSTSTSNDDPNYESADAVVITFLVDNYDQHSTDPLVKKELEKVMAWELTFVEFMKNWTSHEENTK